MKQMLFLGLVASIALIGIYTLITFYDDYMTLGRMRETPVVRPHEEPLLIMEEGTVPLDGGGLLLKESLKKSSFPLSVQASKSQIEFGEKEYVVFCRQCHGINLDGLGTVGQSFHPLPTNLNSRKVLLMTNNELFMTISYGTERSPALASSMSTESRRAVIAYLRSKQNKQ
jgi:mono/diheme cytochrome c family protein